MSVTNFRETVDIPLRIPLMYVACIYKIILIIFMQRLKVHNLWPACNTPDIKIEYIED